MGRGPMTEEQLRGFVAGESPARRRSKPDDDLTEEEHRAILAGVIRAREYTVPTIDEEDGTKVIEWALETRQRAIVLDMVLEGLLDMNVDPGGEVRFKENPERKADIEAMIAAGGFRP